MKEGRIGPKSPQVPCRAYQRVFSHCCSYIGVGVERTGTFPEGSLSVYVWTGRIHWDT